MMRRLEMAIAIDTHRSFQRAARSLDISQPALTRALQTLEAEFGARLFERGKNECEPTAFGRIVLERARRIIAELAQAKREINLMQGLGTGEFRIGVGSASPQQWVGGAIGELCAANPKLRTRYVELAGYLHLDALMSGEIDVTVGDPSDLSGYPDIVVARLPRRPISFFCRKGHPLASLAKVEIEDLAAYPFVGPRLGLIYGQHFPVGSAMGSMSADGRYFEPQIQCPGWTTVREIVSRSDAVSGRIRALLERPENRADLAILPVDAPWFQTTYAIMWRGDRMPHPALKIFRDAVRRHEDLAMRAPGAIHVVAA